MKDTKYLPNSLSVQYTELMQNCVRPISDGSNLSFKYKEINNKRYWYLYISIGSTRREHYLGEDSQGLLDQIDDEKALWESDTDDRELRPRTPIQLGQIILDSGMGFFEVPALNRKQPSTSFKIRGRDFIVDVLQPAVLLYEHGIMINVPAPGRFAIHKCARRGGLRAEPHRGQAALEKGRALYHRCYATENDVLNLVFIEKFEYLAKAGIQRLPCCTRNEACGP